MAVEVSISRPFAGSSLRQQPHFESTSEYERIEGMKKTSFSRGRPRESSLRGEQSQKIMTILASIIYHGSGLIVDTPFAFIIPKKIL